MDRTPERSTDSLATWRPLLAGAVAVVSAAAGLLERVIGESSDGDVLLPRVEAISDLLRGLADDLDGIVAEIRKDAPAAVAN